MKRKTLVMLLLCVVALASHAQSSKDALSEYEWLTDFVRKNYPGYENKTQDRKKELSRLVRQQRSAIVRQPDTLLFIIDEYIRWFNDGHLYLSSTNQGRELFHDILERQKGRQMQKTRPQGTNMYYTAKAMNDSTFFLRIPSFGNQMSNKLVDDNREAITARPYLIIDLRCNGGGNDENFNSLMSLIYSKPYYTHGVELYATPDFLALYRNIAEEEHEDEETKEWYGIMADSVEQHLGGYVLRPGLQRMNLNVRDTVYPNPRKVGILIHGRNASSAEQFILEAKESDKVMLFGNENTRGVIDLSNVYGIPSPKGWFTLHVPTTRSCRCPDIMIDGIGISPQISLPYEESLQERDSIGEEIKYIESVLRK